MNAFESVNAQTWKNALEQESGLILDVRTNMEFEEGLIEGAVNMDIFSEDFMDQLHGLDKLKPWFVYCRSGVRSKRAMWLMQEIGFVRVCELDGGILEWMSAGYEVLPM
ncbi:MAG: rhodanese-like domain-containing protein [Bacteroidetes bacterium]|jgi:rhodanese-related sulfurtransferase|nr:rhodanese-like domain-containing protein [Bacteroidota bacterium]